MSLEPTDVILERKEYDPLIEGIIKWNDQIKQEDSLSGEQYKDYLSNYIKLIHLRDQGYPLLLRNGESLQLNAPPFSIHLLPPLSSKSDRWILLIFLSESSKLQVQIIRWIDGGQNSTLEPLAAPTTVKTESIFPSDPRAKSINVAKGEERSFISVSFQEGILDITVDIDEGIIATAWSSKIRPGSRIERNSWGDMSEAIRIRRNKDENWQDDSIFDKDNQELFKGKFKYGWIKGADSPKVEQNWVYLASNQAKVLRIDKKNLNSEPKQSQRLEGKALDVLIVHISGLGDHSVLVSTNNGMVYLLIPDTKKGFEKTYFQLAGSRIERFIGAGQGNIVSLDSRNKLNPLLVTNPQEFWQQRDFATQHLTHYFFQNNNSALANISDDLYRLLLEYFLWSLGEKDNKIIDDKIIGLFFKLNAELKGQTAKAENDKHIALHGCLINRFLEWLERSSTHERLDFTSFKKIKVLNKIWPLISLDDSAPDYLWLPLLRKSSWLRRWARQNSIVQKAEFKTRLVEWEGQLQTMRLTFSKELNRVRSLTTLNHYQLNSHCDHLEILDKTKNIVAVLEYTGGLCIFQINHSQWELLVKWPATETDEKTQITQWVFIQSFSINQGKNASTEEIYLVLGSSQAELTLMSFNKLNKKLDIIHQHHCPVNLVCCINVPNQNGLLLGGYNAHESAVLYGWSYNKIITNLPPVQLWEEQAINDSELMNSSENGIGSLRRLCLSKDGKQLWGTNREKSCIYKWNLPTQGLFEKNRKLSIESENSFQLSRNLYAMDYSSEQNLLVCGGVGGVVYGLEANYGGCAWTVICSGNLRRVVFLPNYPLLNTDKKGAWLLCGDDKSSLIVDHHGNVLGVIELAGPISASAVNSEKQQLILCTLGGRLMLMDYSGNSSKPQDLNQLPSNIDSIIYPVRAQTINISPEQMEAMLKIRCYDSHSIMATLRAFSDHLQQAPSINGPLKKAFFNFWQQQVLERKIVYLYWLRNTYQNSTQPSQNQIAFTLDILEKAWDNFKSEYGSGLRCKLVSPIFDILNRINNNQKADALLIEMTDYIWLRPTDSTTNNEAPSFDSVRAAIRWNQAAKRWREATDNITEVNPEVLFN